MSESRAENDIQDLDEKTVDRDPLQQFRCWFNDAIASGSRLPESMTLATATKDGRPSARVVLLKHVDENGFVFYTNYRSAKAKQLEKIVPLFMPRSVASSPLRRKGNFNAR